MQKIVYEGGFDLLPRMVGRAALFQAYTSVFGSLGLALGYIHAPPGLGFLSETKAAPMAIAAFSVGFFFTVKNVNSRLVSKMTVDEKESTVKIETISSVSKKDPSITVPLRELEASPFAPFATQLIRARGKTMMVNHRGGKHSDVLFFSSLGKNR